MAYHTTSTGRTACTTTTMQKSSLREYDFDLRESFIALDTEYQESISLIDVYTIYLALDYEPNGLTFLEWKKRTNLLSFDQQRFSFDIVQEILSKV